MIKPMGWAVLGGLLIAGCGAPPAEGCVEKSGRACVWAGTGELGLTSDELPLRQSRLYWPMDVEFSPSGVPYVLDWNNHLIRRVVDGKFETAVGSFIGDGPPDQSDLTAQGAPGDTVSLNHPTDIQFAPDGALVFAAWHNHKIRRLDPITGRVTVLAGSTPGFAGDGKAPRSALFNQPKALAMLPDGSFYILDQRNFRVRKVSAGADPVVQTLVGLGTAGFSGDLGPPSRAQLAFEAGPNPLPSGGLAIDSQGALFISDGRNHRIRKVDFSANTITTVAGTGQAGFGGDGGPAVQALLNDPRDLELGPDGRLYFADTENHRIRAIDLGTGAIDTVVGTGEPGANGEGKEALQTQLNRPFGVAFDPDGNLFVSDTFNSRILKVAR